MYFLFDRVKLPGGGSVFIISPILILSIKLSEELFNFSFTVILIKGNSSGNDVIEKKYFFSSPLTFRKKS